MATAAEASQQHGNSNVRTDEGQGMERGGGAIHWQGVVIECVRVEGGGSGGEDAQLCPQTWATGVCGDEINEIIHREVFQCCCCFSVVSLSLNTSSQNKSRESAREHTNKRIAL